MSTVPERVIEMRKAWAQSDAKRDAGLKEPETVEKYRDISYGPYDTWNLLDIYVPKEAVPAGSRLPVIVSIHGGGFFYGDKELYRFYCMHLAEFGFAVVNYNYRLAPEFHFPSPIEDAMGVLRWVSANADRYGLDTSNVFLVGDSAGAQLVSQVACILTNREYGELFGIELPKDIRVRAIGLSCGTYRLAGREKDSPRNPMMMDYFGDEKLFDDPRTEVLENITADYPPTYIFSAYNDPLIVECEPTAKWLEERGVEVCCRIFGTPEAKEVGHVFQVNMYLEEGEKANREQTDFFKAHMV
ncbi:MAG: alpha/beta hydrolase [Lachnospiraceae bacterium]|nr:alpha/beta hydrolase [Lachnospiraceae bacterium]